MRRLATAFLSLGLMIGQAGSAFSAPIDRGAVKLPEGRMLLVATNQMGAVMISLDNMARDSHGAVVLVYRVFDPPRVLEGGPTITEEAEAQRFDCDAQNYQSLGSSQYNAAGEEVLWTEEEPTKPVRERTMTSRVADVVCGKVQLPSGNIAKDRATAKAMVAQSRAAGR
ncbi:surface-adhesin E family protein [Caulobacter segnis]|uniref:surface-adhesin E family protein n=1 Tax=Caulobacter segnis TaxID=88688 RepID=UPI0028677CA6|nr:surface-adhesin E family protein [Caulobacter segnis]MDR6627914.1 hypothetical protein [Caulobacter segnis]